MMNEYSAKLLYRIEIQKNSERYQSQFLALLLWICCAMSFPALGAQLSEKLRDNRVGETLTDKSLGEIGRSQSGEVGPLLNLPDIPYIDLNIRDPKTNQEVALSLKLLLLLTVITLAPTFAVLLTSFLRISIVLDFIRRAMGLQQAPPTSIIMGVSLFIAVFVMWPVFTLLYDNAFAPLSNGEIDLQEFYLRMRGPLKQFMFQQLGGETRSLELFLQTSHIPQPKTLADIPMQVLIPSYVLHELTVAFRIGILIYIPFIVIDMVVATILMSMGMIMLPPVMISMPFKLLLFVMVDGWNLIIRQLIISVQQNMGGIG